jgi:hypothetical protein
VQLMGPRDTERGMPAAWSGVRGNPRSQTTASSSASRAWTVGSRRVCQVAALAAGLALRTRRQGTARRGAPTDPTRAAIPTGMAGNALPAADESCLVGPA